MNDNEGYIRRGELLRMREDIVEDLQSGVILVPQTLAQDTLVYAGGVNHFPNSDISYSEAAATVAGTLPADPGDTNQEAWRLYRQKRTDDVVFDAAHALKAVDHSLYAADEGVNPEVPIWNRVAGWIEMGSQAGSDEYDIANKLTAKIVKQSETWFFLFRCVSLTDDILPAGVQFEVGLWQKDGAGEGLASGDDFTVSYSIHGTAGTTAINVRVLAKTDSGVSVLSAVLAIVDAPDVLSDADYLNIFFLAAPNAGFIEFTVYSEDVATGTFRKGKTIRNSVDLLYHDTGGGQPATEFPTAEGSAPLAYARTRTLKVGAYGQGWELNQLSFRVPSTYNYALTNSDGQTLRFGLTAPTAVDRQIGIDYCFFSTTLSKWAPDAMQRFADNTYPIPSINPVSGNQGTGGGLGGPPGPGTGGGLCIVNTLPVLRREGRRNVFRQFRSTKQGDLLKGDKLRPYPVRRKRGGMAAGKYVITSANGITAECNARHEWFTDVERRETIQAQQIVAGETKVSSWVRGRKRQTLIVSVKYVPGVVNVGTYVLADPDGELPDGHGVFIAGRSRHMDRGFFFSNAKPLESFT